MGSLSTSTLLAPFLISHSVVAIQPSRTQSSLTFCPLTNCTRFCCRSSTSSQNAATTATIAKTTFFCCSDCRLAQPTASMPSPSCPPNVALIVGLVIAAVVLLGVAVGVGIAVYLGWICSGLTGRGVGQSAASRGATPQGRNSVSSYPTCANYPTIQTRGFAADAAKRYVVEGDLEKGSGQMDPT